MAENKHLGFDAHTDAESGDGGFTLIELMVVVLVIAILLAIAVPTFLGARERSQDRAAQSNLRNAFTAAKITLVDTGDYRNADFDDLDTVEPALTYVAAAVDSTDERSISVDITGTTGAETVWSAAALSESGTCFWIEDDSDTTTGGLSYATAIAAECSAADVVAGTLTNRQGWRTD